MSIVPNSQRTHEQLSEMGRKGGITSGIARRRKKIIREFTKDNKSVSFIDLYGLARILQISDYCAFEWLIIKMFGGLRKEHRKKKNLITLDVLCAMGLSEDRAKAILEEYQMEVLYGRYWKYHRDD